MNQNETEEKLPRQEVPEQELPAETQSPEVRTEENEDKAYQLQQQEIQRLTMELEQTRLDYTVRLALAEAGAEDVDYLLFKLQQEGPLQLDEKGQIADWQQRLSALKTRLPGHFRAKKQTEGSFEGYRPMTEYGMADARTPTRSEILKQPYYRRLELYHRDPEAFNRIMGG